MIGDPTAARETAQPVQPFARARAGDPPAWPALDAAPRRTAERGALLYGQGDTTTGLYLLEVGAVRLHRLTPQGREIPIGVVLSGEMFGEEALVGAGARSSYAEALMRSRVRVAGPQELARWRRERPDFV